MGLALVCVNAQFSMVLLMCSPPPARPAKRATLRPVGDLPAGRIRIYYAYKNTDIFRLRGAQGGAPPGGRVCAASTRKKNNQPTRSV